MLEILINGVSTNWTEPLPAKITSVKVTFITNPFIPTLIPVSEIKKVMTWLNDMVDKCTCDTVVYNEKLIKVSDLQKFEMEK